MSEPRNFYGGETVRRKPVPATETASDRRKHKCQNCGRRMSGVELMLSFDPWDRKEKVVCIDADTCVLARAEAGT